MLKKKTRKKCIIAVTMVLLAVILYNCICKQELSKALIQNSKEGKTNTEYNNENQDGSGVCARVGDINLDGSIDIADVIVLNKYILGVKSLTDEQRAVADCYSDGEINSTDSLTLLKYVLQMIRKLPVDEITLRRAELFADNNNDDFYNEFIKSKNTVFKFNEMAAFIHKTIRQSALDNLETMRYTDTDVEIKDIYVDGNFGSNINSYSYVGLCLYNYAIQRENDALIDYMMESQGKIYGVTDEKAKELGWQKINYTSKDQLQVGDIIVSPESAQIYLGDGVYSCESDVMIQEINLVEPAEPTNSNYIIRIEPKSGKSGNMEWSVDDETLCLNVTGEVEDEDIPWKASLDDINDYEVHTVMTYYASAAGKTSQSLMYSKRGGTRYVTIIVDLDFKSTATSSAVENDPGSSVIQTVKIMKKIQQENPGYDVELVSNEYLGDNFVKLTYKLVWNGNLNDEFYAMCINGKVNAVAKHMQFYEVAQLVKRQIAASRNRTGNVPTYDETRGIYVPKEIYSNGQMGQYIDCSSFVSMCLYEYGVHTGNENIIDFIKHYRVDAGGSIIRVDEGETGVGGQVTASQFYELDDEILDKIGFEMLPYNTDSDLRAGDIIVKSSHIEIYAEKGLVFNCGDNKWLPYVKTEKTIPSREVSPGTAAKILRIKN